jgi:hypothetical protein
VDSCCDQGHDFGIADCRFEEDGNPVYSILCTRCADCRLVSPGLGSDAQLLHAEQLVAAARVREILEGDEGQP